MTNDVLNKNLTISIFQLCSVLQQVSVKDTVTGDKTLGWCMNNYERFELRSFERWVGSCYEAPNCIVWYYL